MTQQQGSGQQPAGVAAARARVTGRWVAGHGVEEALVAAPAMAAVALPVWWAQVPAAAAAVVAAGVWARHEWRARRRVRQVGQYRMRPAPSAAELPAPDDDSDPETDSDGPATGQREVSIHG